MRRLREALYSLVELSDSPRRIALSFSIGVFVGFSPLLGLHTFLAIGIALIFRLNKIATLLGAWINVPWIVVPYYGLATWLGIELLGMPAGIYLPEVGFRDLLEVEFWNWVISQWRLLIPVFVGSTILAVGLSMAAYPVSLFLVRKYRRNFAQTSEDEEERAGAGGRE